MHLRRSLACNGRSHCHQSPTLEHIGTPLFGCKCRDHHKSSMSCSMCCSYRHSSQSHTCILRHDCIHHAHCKWHCAGRMSRNQHHIDLPHNQRTQGHQSVPRRCMTHPPLSIDPDRGKWCARYSECRSGCHSIHQHSRYSHRQRSCKRTGKAHRRHTCHFRCTSTAHCSTSCTAQ
jgi:hypothetical protein|eukprot:COSAG06_NODE_483_length_15127_cov_38.842960_10_plen_175_part_00